MSNVKVADCVFSTKMFLEQFSDYDDFMYEMKNTNCLFFIQYVISIYV
jgi:hypothetical protein